MFFKNETKYKIGMGCWAIGGPFYSGEEPFGYGETDDRQSIQALEAAYEAGIRYFDTAAVYGTGHSERLIGSTLKNKTDCVISTKFGFKFDEQRRELLGEDTDPANVRSAIDACRSRLQRDHIDMIFLHLNSLSVPKAQPLFDELENLRQDGWIGAYGWSTDFPDNVEAMKNYEGFRAVQHAMNVFIGASSMTKLTQQSELMSVIRSPLAMGLLTGKFNDGRQVGAGDVRSKNGNWMDYFTDGVMTPKFRPQIEAIKELLQVDGRTLAQGSLAWLSAKGAHICPIPGAKTAAQVVENAGAFEKGPLPESVMAEIEQILGRPAEEVPRER